MANSKKQPKHASKSGQRNRFLAKGKLGPVIKQRKQKQDLEKKIKVRQMLKSKGNSKQPQPRQQQEDSEEEEDEPVKASRDTEMDRMLSTRVSAVTAPAAGNPAQTDSDDDDDDDLQSLTGLEGEPLHSSSDKYANLPTQTRPPTKWIWKHSKQRTQSSTR